MGGEADQRGNNMGNGFRNKVEEHVSKIEEQKRINSDPIIVEQRIKQSEMEYERKKIVEHRHRLVIMLKRHLGKDIDAGLSLLANVKYEHIEKELCVIQIEGLWFGTYNAYQHLRPDMLDLIFKCEKCNKFAYLKNVKTHYHHYQKHADANVEENTAYLVKYIYTINNENNGAECPFCKNKTKI